MRSAQSDSPRPARRDELTFSGGAETFQLGIRFKDENHVTILNQEHLGDALAAPSAVWTNTTETRPVPMGARYADIIIRANDVLAGQIVIEDTYGGGTYVYDITGAEPNITRVQREDPMDVGGFRTVDMEIIEMELYAEEGGGGGAYIHLNYGYFPSTGQITAGQTWNFQAWYRDPDGPCGQGSNFTNALEVTFVL